MKTLARTLVGVLGAAAILSGFPGRAQDLAPVTPSDLDFGLTLEPEELISAVLARHPALPAAAAAARAARERVRQAGALDDPIAAASLAPLSVASGDAPLGYELQASQRLPYPGKRSLQRAIATAEADVALQGVAQARFDLAATARALFADYQLLTAHAEVLAEHVALLTTFQDVATARYAAGLAPQQAPLQAELELAERLQEQVSLRARQRTLRAQVNALLHRDPEAPLPPPADLELPPTVTSADASAADVSQRPEARAQQAEVAARRAALELAQRDAYPDLELTTGYNSMWNQPEHRWMVGVRVNLPIFRGRLRAEAAEAEARLVAAQAQQQRIEDAFHARLVEAQAAADAARQRAQLYQDRVLPAARDQVQAARAAFESGELPMLALIEAARGLRSAELGYHETVAAYFRQAAKIERELGSRVPALGDAAALTAGGSR